ncbi:MAG TPA: Uma2 family endonuclease [Chloroflexia bacterium]|nr:Uma2 family endonuclease [Chloroflexia bacterium]
MKTKTPATIEDLYRVPGKAELVNGEIVLMSPTGDTPSRAGLRISRSLLDYEDRTQLGRAYPDNSAFVVDLPHRKSFSPDAAFYTGEVPKGVNMKFVVGAPIFAAEVRSEGDYGPAAEKKMKDKRDDYFEAGTQIVWDVDLRSDDVVRAYRADDPEKPTIYGRGEIADAEPFLPGWSIPVDELFK